MSMKMSARTRVVAVAALGAAAALSLAACSPPGTSSNAPSSTPLATGTVKIGFISPTSGAIAAVGQQMTDGWKYYWEKNGFTAGGVTIQMVGYEDDAGDTAKSTAAAQKLVEQLGAQIIVGPLAANTASAVAAYAASKQIVNIEPVAASNDITAENANAYTIRAGSQGATQNSYPEGVYAAKQKGAKTALTLCTDYSYGWESCAGFAQGFAANGGTVKTQLWQPNGNTDFSSQISQVIGAGVDVIYFGSAGGAYGPNFLDTYLKAGGDIKKLILNSSASDQATLTAAVTAGNGDKIIGLASSGYFAEGAGAPQASLDFVAQYQKDKGVIAGQYIAGGYFAASLVAKVFKEKGLVLGSSFVKTIQGYTFPDSIYGSVKWDDHNNQISPVYIRNVAKHADGKLYNDVVFTYPDVDQWNGRDAAKVIASHPYEKNTQYGKNNEFK